MCSRVGPLVEERERLEAPTHLPQLAIDQPTYVVDADGLCRIVESLIKEVLEDQPWRFASGVLDVLVLHAVVFHRSEDRPPAREQRRVKLLVPLGVPLFRWHGEGTRVSVVAVLGNDAEGMMLA